MKPENVLPEDLLEVDALLVPFSVGDGRRVLRGSQACQNDAALLAIGATLRSAFEYQSSRPNLVHLGSPSIQGEEPSYFAIIIITLVLHYVILREVLRRALDDRRSVS